MRHVAGIRGGLVAALVVVVALVAAGSAWMLWPREPLPTDPPPANNVAGNYRACLLQVPGDRAGAPLVAAAWSGLQQAASTGRVNAQQFFVPAGRPSTAVPHINGAVSQRCGVVVVAGRQLLPAVRVVAGRSAQQRFLVVGASLDLPNVDNIVESEAKTVAAEVNTRVMKLADG